MSQHPYPGEIPALRHRLHPAIGAWPVEAGQAQDKLPQWWRDLPDETWEAMLTEWLRRLLAAVAERGAGRVYVDFSDKRGRETLMSLAECKPGPRPSSAICEPTPAAIDALLGTNVSQLVQTAGGIPVLYATSWEETFLCVEDEDLLLQFGEPLARSDSGA